MVVSFCESFEPWYITESKLSHPLNASDPIDVTDDGMVIDVRFLQLYKALLPIDVKMPMLQLM